MSANFFNISLFVLLLVAAPSWSVPVDTDTTDGADDATTPRAEMDDGDAAHHGHSSHHDLKLPQEDIKGSVVCSEHKNLTWTPEFKEKIASCMDPKVYGTEEGMKNPNCMYYCTGHAIGILDEHGMATKDLYDQFIDLAFPENQVAKAKEHVHKCLDDLGANVDPKDAQCVGAKELKECVCQSFSVECE